MTQPSSIEKKTSPNASMSMSSEGRFRLASRERLVLRYYNDGGKDKGHCTYGYGTLVHRGLCTVEEMATEVTQEKADESLNSRIRDAENAIRRNVTQKLNQEQFDALTSFVYNTGPAGASETFRRLNDGDFAAAADVMSERTGSRQNGKLVQLKGLVIRRHEESAPFRLRPEKDKERQQ